MECSVELSMYPLTSDYESTIISFIKRLRKHPFISVETNGMSTQIFGDYDRVMNAVKSEMKNTFLKRRDMLIDKLNEIPGIKCNIPQGCLQYESG